MKKLLTPISHLFKEQSSALKDIIKTSDCLEARERTFNLRLDNTTHYHIDFDLNIGLTEDQKNFLNENVKNRESIVCVTFQAARDCERVKLEKGIYQPLSGR